MNTELMQQPAGSQATVICLHSSGSTGGQWAALRAQLEPGVQVLTPDFHGHGAGPAWHGFDEDIVAADAARVAHLAEAVPGGVHLVGHSYGGAIALRVALYHPENVASVAIYEPVVFRLLFDYHGRRRPASEVIEIASDMRRRLESGNAAGAAARFVDYWGGGGAWRALRAPIRRIGELLRFALPNATFDTMTTMGHMGPITHPGAVAQRIARFVREHAFVPGPVARKLAA
jgi:pimeloyl-ACP methyl ester carboxylesterase